MPARPPLLTLFLLVLLPLSAWSQALPKQPILPLTIGKEKVLAEVVFTPEAMARGLMFRDQLGPNEGMLFVYPRPRPASFWMKNTSIPLSIAYIDSQGIILELHNLDPLSLQAVASSSDQVQYALEMNRGWFEARQIKVGTKIAGLPPVKY